MEGKLLRCRLAWLIVGYTKLWVHSFLYMVVFFSFCRHHKTACRQAGRQADEQIDHQSQTTKPSYDALAHGADHGFVLFLVGLVTLTVEDVMYCRVVGQ